MIHGQDVGHLPDDFIGSAMPFCVKLHLKIVLKCRINAGVLKGYDSLHRVIN